MQVLRVIRRSGWCFLLLTTAWAGTINSTTISGNQIAITGTGFTGSPLTVTFDGKSIPIVSSSPTQIVATLSPFPAPGSYRLVVKAGVVSTLAFVTAPASPGIIAQVTATETGLVSPTTIFTSSVHGLYRVALYMVEPTTTANEQCASSPNIACGLVTPLFQWTDDGGSQETYPLGGPQAGLYLWNCTAGSTPSCGNAQSVSFLVSLDAGTPLIYSIVGTDSAVSYELLITVEQLI